MADGSLRVTHVLPLEASLGEATFGGMERYALDLAGGLAERGIDVELLALLSTPNEAIESRLAALRPHTRLEICWLRPERPWWTARKRLPFHTAALLRAFRARRGRIVHLHLPGTDLMQIYTARPFARALVASQHSALPDFRRRAYRAATRLGDRAIDRYLPVSDAVRDVLVDEVGIDPRKVQLLEHGVPAPVLDRSRRELRHELGITDDRFAIGYLGRLVDMKNVDVLIDAVARLPDVRLEVVGDGAARTALEARARASGVGNVTFHGFRADSREIMRAFDLIALVSDWEGKPLSIVEAMLAGVPVLGSDVRGTRDVLEHGRLGVMVPPRDVAATTDAIAAARSDPARREAVALAARRHAEATYSLQRMANELIAVYQSFDDRR